MACRLNLAAAARLIHSAPPSDLDGLYQAALKKAEECGVQPGRRDPVTPDISGDPNTNIRGVLRFIEGVEALGDGDDPGKAKTDDDKNAATVSRDRKLEQHGLLRRLLATLETRVKAANYTPPKAEPDAPPPPLAEKTPDPVPLA